ncbi:hypothetical protein [Parasitella parasitica]|uniref:Uncharacterized protein n=1 Tax=Parasitella parasitica TaxID=35722 RepID=A0A0B7N2V6_9FUNG|nr:hypothetical protein [Parasitella parasitica]
MECLETEQLLSKTVHSENTKTSTIVGCQFHQISFAVSEQGQLLTVDCTLENLELDKHHLIDGVEQIVANCSKNQEECDFYLRTSTNTVYRLSIELINGHPRKRAKMDQKQMQPINLIPIASNVKHLLIHHGLVLISSKTVQRLKDGILQDTNDFYTADFDITSLQSVETMHSSFVDFFSLQKNFGLIYGTRDGAVNWRDFGAEQDTLLFRMEQDERVVYIDFIQASNIADTLIAVGEQGTIIVYMQADQGLEMKQFNIQSPVYAIDKVQSLRYVVSTGIGKVSLLDLNQSDKIETTRMLNISKVKHLRVLDNDIFETISEINDCIELKRIRYNKVPISIENDTAAMQQLIEETLQELAQEEAMVRSMEIKEKELSDKLASTNRTLYALRSINDRRELGLCNSFDSTGFEFSVRPITKSNSNENCSLNTQAYLRICIKSSRFLELEGWDLSIQIFPIDSMIGETRLISVIGFEPYYENGIERHVIWERDIELDLTKQRLPAKVSTTLIMAVDNKKELRFPVSEMIIDDIHFARPCSSHIKTSIERRGLDEISTRLMQSYQQQRLHDRTGKYPFARLLQQQQQTRHGLSHQKNVHIRYTVSSLSEEQYRSILPNILGEGHAGYVQDFFHGNAEQALFTMTSYHGCLVLITLSRVSPEMIDFGIQCTHPPALFKVESILLNRVHHLYTPDAKMIDSKALRPLETSILKLQQAYQQDDEDLELKETLDILCNLHNQEPIGCLTFI